MKKISLALFLCLSSFLCSCTKKQKIQYVEQNDAYHNSAYNTYNGKIMHLKNGEARFYLDVQGDYEVIARYSVDATNKFSNLHISADKVKNRKFKFTTYESDDGATAYTTTPYSDVISYGTIYYNICNINVKSNSAKATALHEMGHILGLKDIYDDNLKTETIMWHSRKTGFWNYTELDIENILWYYQGTYSK